MSGEVDEYSERRAWFRLSNWFRWCPTSTADLAQAERKILAHIWHLIDSRFVPISNRSNRIRTIAINEESENTPLVLVHGMGAGVGLWALNLASLSRTRPVYALDVLGFGRSSRPRFNSDPALTELEFIESIEEWRKELQLDRFILLGHSLGGFLAASYALRFPQRVRHLVLVDAWGFPEQAPDSSRRTPTPTWIKVVSTLVKPFNPLAGLRAVGPWGPQLVGRLRPDLKSKFNHLYEDNTVSDYVYHCNAQQPSGEVAFKNMTIAFGWARYPMIRRIGDLPNSVDMTLLYGSRSWIDSAVGYDIKYIRNGAYVDVQVIKGAGHHVYADRAEAFNSAVNRIGEMVDET